MPNATVRESAIEQNARAVAKKLVRQALTYLAINGVTRAQIGAATGIAPKTLSQLWRNDFPHYPNLVTFLKILHAHGLDIQIVKVANLPRSTPYPQEPQRC